MASEPNTEKAIEAKEFFEKTPPGVKARVSGLPRKHTGPPLPLGLALPRPRILPDIELYCPTQPTCDGVRSFSCMTDFTLNPGDDKNVFITYRCRNCGSFLKVYALWANCSSETDAILYKFGEHPSFGARL